MIKSPVVFDWGSEVSWEAQMMVATSIKMLLALPDHSFDYRSRHVAFWDQRFTWRDFIARLESFVRLCVLIWKHEPQAEMRTTI
jgi:hypothetical protein